MAKKPPIRPQSYPFPSPFPSSRLLLLIPIMLLSLFLLLSSLPSLTTTPISLQQACRSSLYPSLCLSSLSSQSQQPQPQSLSSLLLLSLSLPSQSLQTALSLSQSILTSSSSNPSRKNAAQNCLAHLALSSSRLASVSNSIPTSIDGPSLANYRAFASAALLYQYDCWSALKYVNSTKQVASAMEFVANLTRLTSNSLAMIAAVQRFGDNLANWGPPQTERDGYWPDYDHLSDDDDVVLAFPSDLTADVTVCKSNECHYATVQEAVNAAPGNGAKRFVIWIKTGVYEEIVRVPLEKTNVVFLGDGMGKTIIVGRLNAQMSGVTTYNTATVGVSGDGFMAKDLTFENAAGPGSHQAVAFMSDSDRSFMHSVEFVGHQDTLYARSLRQVYQSCRILGTVDFIFGNSAAVFKDCLILVVPRQEGPEKGESDAVTAHGRTDPGQATGFVFRNCTVNGSNEYVEIYRRSRPGRHKVYLGRPWKEYSRTVYLNCYLEEMVRPEGWMPFRGEFALKTLFYGESGSRGAGANESGRVEWSNRIPEERVGVYSVRNFLQGDQWVSSAV